MLVLTRRFQERIYLDAPDGKGGIMRIVVAVVTIDRNKVRLGIEAPQAVTIRRKELVAEDDRESGGRT